MTWQGRAWGKVLAELWRDCVSALLVLFVAINRTIDSMSTIAVVDDEANIRETVAFALRREGYDVETYPDGLEAATAFDEKLPDLAILDILMPRMDGLE